MGDKLSAARSGARGESGFTLIEVLVVVVIIGILAAIALPLFLNQKNQAGDADAKSLVRGASGVLESYAATEDAYDMTRAEILEEAPELSTARAWHSDTTKEYYEISVTSDSGNVFRIQRDEGTSAILTCTTPGRGGCPSDGLW
jgi:type IV pilus assembly protein PilA